jgi:hypothetical protein
MSGRSPALDHERATSRLKEILATHAKPIVEIRARGERMIVCVVADADEAAVQLCRRFGLDLRRGGIGIFGVSGEDVVRLFPSLRSEAWLASPCGPRETKVLLITAGGLGLLSIETNEGKVTITPIRASRPS